MSHKHPPDTLPSSEVMEILQTLSKDQAHVNYFIGTYTRSMEEELLLRKERELKRSKTQVFSDFIYRCEQRDYVHYPPIL